MDLLIAIPVFNEENNVLDVIESLPKSFAGIQACRVLVVDDGSCDDTLLQISTTDVEVISHGSNLGLGFAFNSAKKYFLDNDFDIMVTIDGDGQFDPQDIEYLLRPLLNKSCDFCLGSRFEQERPTEMSYIKYFGNRIYARVISLLTKGSIKDASCGFRAYSRKSLMNLSLVFRFTYTHATLLELLYKNFKHCEIPISVKYFKTRQSHLTGNLFKYGFETVFIISKVVLRFRPKLYYSILGLVAMIIIFMWQYYTELPL